MKKIFILFIIACGIAPILSCYSIDTICPQWSEFAPEKYVDVKYDESEQDFERDKNIIMLGALSIVGAPYSYYRLVKGNLSEKNNYWYRRRIAFENEMQICREITDKNQQYACYMNVRKIEEDKTIHYKEFRLKQKEINAINNNFYRGRY